MAASAEFAATAECSEDSVFPVVSAFPESSANGDCDGITGDSVLDQDDGNLRSGQKGIGDLDVDLIQSHVPRRQTLKQHRSVDATERGCRGGGYLGRGIAGGVDRKVLIQNGSGAGALLVWRRRRTQLFHRIARLPKPSASTAAKRKDILMSFRAAGVIQGAINRD